jgi:hypothetical protein
VGDPGQLFFTFLSPDGNRATVSVYDRAAHNNDLWIYDLARNLRTRFTFGSGNENAGIWSPDGNSIVFNSSSKGHLDLYCKLASGAGEELLYADELSKSPTSWSPEWTWDNREIWTDGRELPNVDDYLPRFNGYSVGKWEGDTLVVTTVGLDDRQWVDAFGYPISDKAVLEERYTRPSPNRLRVEMTLTDPAMYTRPWHASPKVWALIPKQAMSIGGWAGLVEDRCVPSDNSFYSTIEDRAAGLKK